MASKLYQDEAWLRKEYIDNKRSSTYMAEECGVSPPTILDWLERYGIPRRSQKESHKPDKEYTDRDWLEREYIDNKRSMRDIGEECDVSAAVILKWLRRFGIETRRENDYKRLGPVIFSYEKGELGELPGPYVKLRSSITNEDGKREYSSVYVHQLIAIAEGADPYEVFSNGEHHVHHENGIRWDNRPENIEFLTGSDHIRKHFIERGGLQPWQG